MSKSRSFFIVSALFVFNLLSFAQTAGEVRKYDDIEGYPFASVEGVFPTKVLADGTTVLNGKFVVRNYCSSKERADSMRRAGVVFTYIMTGEYVDGKLEGPVKIDILYKRNLRTGLKQMKWNLTGSFKAGEAHGRFVSAISDSGVNPEEGYVGNAYMDVTYNNGRFVGKYHITEKARVENEWTSMDFDEITSGNFTPDGFPDGQWTFKSVANIEPLYTEDYYRGYVIEDNAVRQLIKSGKITASNITEETLAKYNVAIGVDNPLVVTCRAGFVESRFVPFEMMKHVASEPDVRCRSLYTKAFISDAGLKMFLDEGYWIKKYVNDVNSGNSHPLYNPEAKPDYYFFNDYEQEYKAYLSYPGYNVHIKQAQLAIINQKAIEYCRENGISTEKFEKQ